MNEIIYDLFVRQNKIEKSAYISWGFLLLHISFRGALLILPPNSFPLPFQKLF